MNKSLDISSPHPVTKRIVKTLQEGLLAPGEGNCMVLLFVLGVCMRVCACAEGCVSEGRWVGVFCCCCCCCFLK